MVLNRDGRFNQGFVQTSEGHGTEIGWGVCVGPYELIIDELRSWMPSHILENVPFDVRGYGGKNCR